METLSKQLQDLLVVKAQLLTIEVKGNRSETLRNLMKQVDADIARVQAQIERDWLDQRVARPLSIRPVA